MMRLGILSVKRKIQLSICMFQVFIFINLRPRKTAGCSVHFYEAYQ